MKMIHCADLHLDSELNTNLTPRQANARRQELLANFSRMIDYAVNEGVKVILIAGDLFDREKISDEAARVVYQEIANHPQLVFFYLTGNHERRAFIEAIPSLPKNLKLFRDTWTSYRFHGGEVTIHGMNPGAGYETDLYEKLNCQPDSINIVLLHGQIASTKASKSAPENISLKDLAHRNIDYLALGHIHSYREGELDARGVYVYPGCMEGRGFDEAGEHGFVLLHVEPESHHVEWELIPWQKRRVCEVAVDLSDVYNTAELLNAIDEALELQLQEEKLSEDDLVHVELIGETGLLMPDVEWIKNQYDERFYAFKVTNSSVPKKDRSVAPDEHSLKAEFLRLVRADESLSDENKRAVLQYGMAALRGEEVQP